MVSMVEQLRGVVGDASGIAVERAAGAMRTIARKIGIVQEIARQTDLPALNAGGGRCRALPETGRRRHRHRLPRRRGTRATGTRTPGQCYSGTKLDGVIGGGVSGEVSRPVSGS